MRGALAIVVCSMFVAACAAEDLEEGGELDTIELGACPTRHLEVTYDTPHQLSGGRLRVQEARDTSVRVVESASGDRHVRSELAYGDPQVAGGPRAETEASGNGAFRYDHGDTFYYGFRVYIPSGWVDDGIHEDVLFQWHNIPDYELGESSKSPNMFLAVKRTEFVLRVTSDARRVSTSTSPLKLQFPVAAIDTSRSQWHDFVVAVTWSHQDGSGRVRVWHKRRGQTSYSKKVDHLGPNMHNDIEPGYLKWGIYKPAWRSGRTAASKRVVKHDNIRVGQSFSEVRPDQADCE